jgi:phospholipid transport system substrate-binding protein
MRRYGAGYIARSLLVTILLAVFALPAMASSPVSVIEEASQLLDEGLSGEGRKEALKEDRTALYQLIDSILLPRFDRTYAAQLVLGKYWRTATNDQKQRFIEAFYQSLLQRYADGVLEYDQSRVEILPFSGDLTQPRNKVQTMVTMDDGTKVPVDYWLVNRKDNWLVFDVRIEGISYVQNFRSELNSEIQATSLEKVIERLEADTKAVSP